MREPTVNAKTAAHVHAHLGRLQAALTQYGGAGWSWNDVVDRLSTGDAQVWTEDDAVVVTQIVNEPHGNVIHVWLAAGQLDAVVSLGNEALEWGKHRHACAYATIHGRKGWERALRDEGWEYLYTGMGRKL